MEIYKKSNLTWIEIYDFLKEMLSYGDDPFEDMYSEFLEKLKIETDPQIKINIETILNIMDFLGDIVNF